jgi:ribonuclease J
MRKKGFVAVIKGEPGYEKWIERFGDLNPVVVYSMWEGYVEPGNEAFDKGLYDFVEKYHGICMHTSGHAPAEVIGEVIRRVCPMEAVIPIHMENGNGFGELLLSFSHRYNL